MFLLRRVEVIDRRAVVSEMTFKPQANLTESEIVGIQEYFRNYAKLIGLPIPENMPSLPEEKFNCPSCALYNPTNDINNPSSGYARMIRFDDSKQVFEIGCAARTGTEVRRNLPCTNVGLIKFD